MQYTSTIRDFMVKMAKKDKQDLANFRHVVGDALSADLKPLVAKAERFYQKGWTKKCRLLL